MQTVDVYIGTDLRGPAKGTGRVMYAMWTRLKNGSEKESKRIAEFDNTTESDLVLRGIWDALQRLNFACSVVIHTECTYVAASIENHWPEAWQENSWRNSKGKEIKDALIWGMILQELEESGHEITVQTGKHTWSHWMYWDIPLEKAIKGTFIEIKNK